ncbi:LysM peptidoglycan-binding domain-containing protein [Candidatus Merdisoma sp. HCP28S3_D10]|uniref:LysM peptidoglycan-binding domain-containing protein n=1 Tax=unclassified Candidatus Merdisoma TaxID=3099611 RepID=UPI003F8CCD2B
MIEFVYRENSEEKGTEWKPELPKNVKQIGEPEEKRKIYIEDYVITYLKRLAGEETLNSKLAILLGDTERAGGISYLFIKGAVGLKDLEYTEQGIPFTDEVWAEIYGTMKEYFADLDILGWYLSLPGYPMELSQELLKVHRDYFGGADKLLMVSDSADGEADFFVYENGKMLRQSGYAIFYQQNEAMQRYMIETGNGESIDEKEHFEDRAIQSFRTIIQEKKEQNGQKRVLTFLYMASTFLVMVVLVIGITLINNYEKMEGMETALRELSNSLEQQDSELADAYADLGQAEDTADDGKEDGEDTAGEESAAAQESTAAGEPAASADVPAQSGTPTDVSEEASDSAPDDSNEEASVPDSYTVRKGDTLLKISRRIYGRDDEIDAICSLNGIEDSDRILEGQKLLLP